MRKMRKGGRPSQYICFPAGNGLSELRYLQSLQTERAMETSYIIQQELKQIRKREEGRMPVEENSKASTAKTVMGFLAAVSLFVLMFLAFHNNAATVELAQRQTAIAEKLKELGKG